MCRRRQAMVLALLLAACDGGPIGAGDAGRREPQRIAIGDERATLHVQTDPLRFVVERADGTTAIEAAAVAIELGVAAGGDTRWHDPSSPEPSGVRWSPLEQGADPQDGAIRVSDADGRIATLRASVAAPGVLRLGVQVAPEHEADVALMRVRLAADARGTYQGLGERFYGADARGWIVPMQLALGGRTSGLNEHHVPVPFLVSSNGYGVFVESREAGAFDVGATDLDEVRASFEGSELSIYLYVHEDPREVVAAYTRQTGLPILPPRWAFAPMHWRNEWTDRGALEEDAARIRAEDIPCTSFWIDNPWQTSYNDLTFDETRFPGAQSMLEALRTQGYMPLLWSTPYLDAVAEGESATNAAEELFVTARDAGWLVRHGRAENVFISPASPGAPGAIVDFTSDDAASFWQSRVAATVAMGVRAFKLDYGEDILVELAGARSGFRFANGHSERELHNVFNTLYHGPYRRALDEGAPQDGGFLLVRASSWGGQSVADIVWPGDLDNDLREAGTREVGGLPAAISALISLAASGFPTFGSDTGGYRGGMPDRESLLRWAEHTAFTPILQLGGAGEHHNPWLYDAEAGAIYRRLARAHMDLVPYLRVQARRASQTGFPPVAHPSLVWPDDEAGHADGYVYLLGPDLLVAPVIAPGASSRALHVPPGRFVHFFTGARFDGPADVIVEAPIGTPVVLVRAGALIPMLPADVDTLVDAEPPLIGPSDRPFLRALSIPAGASEVATEEGPVLGVERTAEGLLVSVRPRAGEIADVRFEIDLDDAEPPIASVTSVEVGGEALAPAADAASVQAGCDGVCWHAEGTTLWLSARSSAPQAIEAR